MTRRERLEGIRERILEAKGRMLQARPELATRDVCDELGALVEVLLEAEPEPVGISCHLCGGEGTLAKLDGSVVSCPECGGDGRVDT